MIDQTLKYTNQIQLERRKLQEEKDSLQEELDKFKLNQKDEVKEREKFYEGASWLGRQNLSVAETQVQQVENLRLEYIQKVAEAKGDEFLRGRAAEWLVEATLRLTQKTRDET